MQGIGLILIIAIIFAIIRGQKKKIRMIFEHQSKNKKALLITSLIILVLGVLMVFYSNVIFQEGNPWPQIKGLAQLTFGNQDIVKLAGKENKYITKSNNQELIKSFMKDNGYDFTEQMGSGYFFQNDRGDRLVAVHKFYSRFYSIWTISETNNLKESIEWINYKNEEYGFMMSYPEFSISNYFWGANLPEGLSPLDLLLPNQILNKNNNFYLTQKYNLEINQQTGELMKTENSFIPEYKENDFSYPLPWHIVVFDVENETDLDLLIKNKLGSGCSFKSKIATSFANNYRVEIDGDGKDLGSTNCPVNYANYIIYSPVVKKVAFWSIGQECNIGLGFGYDNCWDGKIADSFHFYDYDFVFNREQKITTTENSNNPANNLWTTTTNRDGVTYQYPKELLAKYISIIKWPPVVKIETGTYSCKTTPPEVSRISDITSKRMVDDRAYCVNVKHEGAAGSVYSSYAYTTVKNDKLIKVSFALQYPNCNNYDDKQNEACVSERQTFDVDSTVDRIVQSIK
ncbi:MAG TPA: hypothetical protein PK412_03465 [bacterium]|nr:hypothetical protein [bacterium]